ncbi:M15 family metallopeptidase [Microbacterium sp. C7(2022)]|uniref:M15 family metallopeptidase n=1 Tax=Microbacterium sp. C7(2022) TaxID=2992759 RepID=UPI00237C20CF|nr:M15 family metallopeptidase [Microbacterium sp. C7(2022)]MDE0545117.1 M15 family metallopeptidase [Microbacterium sp. C7(2022)]
MTSPDQRSRRRAEDGTPGMPSRREARATALLAAEVAPVRHARARRAARIGMGFGAVAIATLLVGSAVAVTAALTGPAIAHDQVLDAVGARATLPMPEEAEQIPAPDSAAVAAASDPCAVEGVTGLIDDGDDDRAIAAAGGGEAVRAAIADGGAACFALDDPTRVWTIINKVHAFDPVDYSPSPLTSSLGVRNLSGGSLRADAAAALAEMADAIAADGAGEIALHSGYRSYTTQQGSYGRQVASRGVEGADLVSARPGHSEHQSGLAADVVACNGGCGSIDDLAATAQGEWIAANSWEYGWIVRYEEGHTEVSGYLPEPWHLRYIGTELAQAYHDGDFHTLEDFFALEPAPDYVD